MKITCQKCRFKNDLGRVFCTSCGTRLDFSETAVEDMRSASHDGLVWGRLVGKVVGVVILTAALLLGGLAAWPLAKPVGAPARPGGLARVRERQQALREALAVGDEAAVSVVEADLNGYLAARAKKAGLTSLSVQLTAGRFLLRSVQSLGPWQIGPLNVGPVPVSYDISGAPVKGALNVKRVAIGHLPLMAPFSARVTDRIATLFADEAHQYSRKITDIRVFGGKVEITAKKSAD